MENAVKLDKFIELDSKIVPEIWAAHFTEKTGNLGVSMPAKLGNIIKSRLCEYPMFILPISRLTGHEILLLESIVGGENYSVQVTGLEDYKKMGPQAPILASFSFFTELEGEKDLTLVHGRFDGTKMNLNQSSSLLQTFCAAYSRDELFQWIKDFTNRPNDFNFEDFLKTFTQK